MVSDTGGQVQYWAQYGLTKAYDSESAHQTINVAQNTPTTVNVELTGLQRATLYHYRLCAQDSQQQGGPGCGEDRTSRPRAPAAASRHERHQAHWRPLLPAGQPGFIVGADGVDIDLAGYDMNGGISVGGGGPTAIDNRGGFDDVTVRNGSIVAFGSAFASENASRNRFLDSTRAAPASAITSTAGRTTRSAGAASSAAARRSGPSTRTASSSPTPARQRLLHRDRGLGDGTRLVRNELAQAGPVPQRRGIELAGINGRIAYNHVEGWTGGGIVVSGSDNAIVGNRVLNNPLPGSQPNQGFGDGILVNAFSAHTLLRANRADGNGDDGIDVRDGTARLGDNTATTTATSASTRSPA